VQTQGGVSRFVVDRTCVQIVIQLFEKIRNTKTTNTLPSQDVLIKQTNVLIKQTLMWQMITIRNKPFDNGIKQNR